MEIETLRWKSMEEITSLMTLSLQLMGNEFILCLNKPA